MKQASDRETPLGLVSKVLPQSFVDGPGNRAVVFLQGCNLNCLYCHNPYMINPCNHCGDCVSGCPSGALVWEQGKVQWSQDRCIECDACIESCQHNASPQVRQMHAAELWQEIEAIGPFLAGITVSGGEATLQTDFVRSFFSKVKDCSELTTMIQTNGVVTQDLLEMMLPVTDGFMVDLKAFDANDHTRLTGHGNSPVLETIRFLSGRGKLYQVRQVIVPGVNDTAEQVAETASFLHAIDPAIDFRLLRFRPHGANGIAKTWTAPSDDVMIRAEATAKAIGLVHVGRSI